MNSRGSTKFWAFYAALPEDVREQARGSYRMFKADPYHPGLQFKSVHTRRPIYSARIGLHYRALATIEGDTAIWFWIGPHAEYDRILKRL